MTGKIGVAGIVTNDIAPVATSLGYKRHGFVFTRARGPLLHVIDVQASRSDRKQFTLNFGVFEPESWKILWDKTAPEAPGPECCLPALRAGKLITPEGRLCLDKWWSAEDLSAGSQVVSLIKDRGDKFLGRFQTARDIVVWLDSREQLMPSQRLQAWVICTRCGEVEKAARLLAPFTDVRLKAWAPRVARVQAAMASL